MVVLLVVVCVGFRGPVGFLFVLFFGQEASGHRVLKMWYMSGCFGSRLLRELGDSASQDGWRLKPRCCESENPISQVLQCPYQSTWDRGTLRAQESLNCLELHADS